MVVKSVVLYWYWNLYWYYCSTWQCYYLLLGTLVVCIWYDYYGISITHAKGGNRPAWLFGKNVIPTSISSIGSSANQKNLRILVDQLPGMVLLLLLAATILLVGSRTATIVTGSTTTTSVEEEGDEEAHSPSVTWCQGTKQQYPYHGVVSGTSTTYLVVLLVILVVLYPGSKEVRLRQCFRLTIIIGFLMPPVESCLAI